MKTGLCPTCGHQTVIYDRLRCADRLWCENPKCNFYTVQADAGFNAAMAKAFPPDTTTFYEDAPGYWDNRCAAISPVGKVSGCGTRVEGIDGRD
jgi:hypothetical protein